MSLIYPSSTSLPRTPRISCPCFQHFATFYAPSPSRKPLVPGLPGNEKIQKNAGGGRKTKNKKGAQEGEREREKRDECFVSPRRSSDCRWLTGWSCASRRPYHRRHGFRVECLCQGVFVSRSFCRVVEGLREMGREYMHLVWLTELAETGFLSDPTWASAGGPGLTPSRK